MTETAEESTARATSAAARPRGPDKAPLGNRYWRLLGATGVSAVGNGMAFVALPLLAVTMTKDPLLIAGVAVAGQLPWLVFALPAGALADRVNRRRLAVEVEVFRAAVLTAFVVTILTGHR